MSSSGFIKLHRRLLDSITWQQSAPPQKAVLITVLLMANHAPQAWRWQGQNFTAQPGQFITSIPKLVKNAGVSEKNVRTALKNLVAMKFITEQTTKHGRLITVVNW